MFREEENMPKCEWPRSNMRFRLNLLIFFFYSFTHLSMLYSLLGAILIAEDSMVSQTMSILRAYFLVYK